jgi:hypothetical protein
MADTLYAWATPLWPEFPDLADHTWVTTYDETKTPYQTIEEVKKHNQHYWYCWGSFCAPPGDPTRLLAQQVGSLKMAACLVTPNLPCGYPSPADGTIYNYGIDGVCHQLANQVLYATGGTLSPITVAGANAYWASVYLYGTYGTTQADWQAKINQCGGAHVASAAAAGGGAGVNLPPDDFEKRARAVLGHESPLLGPLLALRAQAIAQKRLMAGAVVPDAATLNAHNQVMLDQAAALLGPQKFQEIFGFPPGTQIPLVDPKMLRR